ncbi:group II intron reverse transcriptase/maturase [Teredinibacter haidensis]|uniref:group II intron reverse transcriptase/maturase n=1 Tax=Teredinibacter haidensis TaxID=2731755 RepID=UPI00094896C5|nr:group II intron reverse transcriptase/maturase [Teredinibacter haidensis]
MERIERSPNGDRLVSESSKPRSEPPDERLFRGEATVWTDRMLTALGDGVKGGKWHSLMDKVYALKTLRLAWKKVRANKGAAGVDNISIVKFDAHAARYIEELHDALKTQCYEPKPVKRVYIPKADGGERPLGIPTIKDRIVQMAIKMVLEPIFENEFCDDSYGFRPKRSAKDALREVNRELRAGKHWVVDADIKGYFDAIDHSLLISMLKEYIADQTLLGLITSYLNQNILDGVDEWTPIKGSPQGAVLSPLLANIYLTGLDKTIGESHKIIRYADDFVILCRSQEEAELALGKVTQWTEQHQLTLHPTKTKISHELSDEHGFDFLGYTFREGFRYARAKAIDGLRSKIRIGTRRQPGKSIKAVIAGLNRVLRGWFEYFKHAWYTLFRFIDGFVRRRLRSILRKYLKKSGGTGRNVLDHIAWPNIFFAKLGLFTMHEAFVRASESRC